MDRRDRGKKIVRTTIFTTYKNGLRQQSLIENCISRSWALLYEHQNLDLQTHKQNSSSVSKRLQRQVHEELKTTAARSWLVLAGVGYKGLCQSSERRYTEEPPFFLCIASVLSTSIAPELHERCGRGGRA